MEYKNLCSMTKDLLPRFFNKTLDEQTTKEIELHLQSCKECQKHFDSFSNINIDSQESQHEMTRYKKIAHKIRKKKILTALSILFVFIFIVITFFSLFQPFIIVGDRMGLTLGDGEMCTLNRLAYCFSSPQYYDLILYRDEKTIFAHIVALPGDNVSIQSGNISVNGIQIDIEVSIPETEMLELTLSEGEYFVLQDFSQEINKLKNCINKDKIMGKITVW